MKCLSLWNPWAVLLVTGHKRVETRSWPIRHRGAILVHAAKKWSAELHDLCSTPPFANALTELGFVVVADLPFGAVVGRVDVIDCFPTGRVRVEPADSAVGVLGDDAAPARKLLIGPTEAAFGDYSPGRFAFLCANPVRFPEPVPFRGAMGIFDVPDDLIREASR